MLFMGLPVVLSFSAACRAEPPVPCAGTSRMLFTTEVAMSTKRLSVNTSRRFPVVLLFSVLAVLLFAPRGWAQSPPPAQPPQQQPDQATPDAGGPGGDSGVIVVPKKKETPEDT